MPTVTLTSSTTWTAPARVRKVTATCDGHGGNGGTSTGISHGAGGGGGGGRGVKADIPVTPGAGYAVTIDASGASFVSALTVLGEAGADGGDADDTSFGSGGGGGGWVGDSGTDGEDGSDGSIDVGGAGGNGGGGGGGGNGGGPGFPPDGADGSDYGGGGGGAGYVSGAAGAGGGGRVILSYEPEPFCPGPVGVARAAGSEPTVPGEPLTRGGTQGTVAGDACVDLGPCACCGGGCCLTGKTVVCLTLQAADSPFPALAGSGLRIRITAPAGRSFGGTYWFLLVGSSTDPDTGIIVCYEFWLPVTIECTSTGLRASVGNPLSVPTAADNLDCTITPQPYAYLLGTPVCDGSDDGACYQFGDFGFLADSAPPAFDRGNRCGVNLWRDFEQVSVTKTTTCTGTVNFPAATLPADWFQVPFCGGFLPFADFDLHVSLNFAGGCAADDDWAPDLLDGWPGYYPPYEKPGDTCTCDGVTVPPPPVTPCASPPCGQGSNPGPGDDAVTVPPGCCDRGEAVSTTLHVAIASAGGSACLATTWAIAWSNAFKVWISSTLACGAFLTVAAFCDGDTWCVRVWLNGVLVFSRDGDFATDTGDCSPLSLTWSMDLTGVPGAAGIATGAFDLHVFEDPDV